MIEITTITIIISAVTLFLAIVSPMFNALFRAPEHKGNTSAPDHSNDTSDADTNHIVNTGTQNKQISIVIIAHDNAPELENSLPSFLSQDYASDYEVIVVADESDSDTDDVIKRFANHKKLYATFLPHSSRYISRKKLAITLGIKAAKYPWVIVTDAWCKPENDQWLRSFAQYCSDDKEIVIGHTFYDDDAPVAYQYEHSVHAAYNLRSATKGKGITTNSPLVAIRKDFFMKENGFLGNLKFVRGEYAFLVNKFSNKENTGVAIAPSSFLIEDTPFKKRWGNNHLFAINAQGCLDGFYRLRTLYHLDNGLMHLCNLALVAGIIYGSIAKDWIALGVSIFAFIVEYALRAFFARKAMITFRAHVPLLIVPLLDFIQPLKDLFWRIKYLFADKYDFITHKI